MTEDSAEKHSLELRSFGRRRGRKPSPAQAALMSNIMPKVALDLAAPAPQPFTSSFAANTKEVWMEIGFGGGEHLLWQAENNPDVGFIGCEPFEDGVVKVLRGIEQNTLSNIRVHVDDARDVLRWLPDASLTRVFVLFPDPWPKARHRKRRLVNELLLREIARVLVTDGELRLATDISDYARTMFMALQNVGLFDWTARRPADWRERPNDWPGTRYEQKAEREGRKSIFLSLRKK